MKQFRKIKRPKKLSKQELQDRKVFYAMLLKFEKRHPNFSAVNVLLKLYPDTDPAALK